MANLNTKKQIWTAQEVNEFCEVDLTGFEGQLEGNLTLRDAITIFTQAVRMLG